MLARDEQGMPFLCQDRLSGESKDELVGTRSCLKRAATYGVRSSHRALHAMSAELRPGLPGGRSLAVG